MTKYEAVRSSTQREVDEIVGRHLDGFHSEHFSREEAEDALGKSWSNVSDVSVTSGDVADVLEAVSEFVLRIREHYTEAIYRRYIVKL